MKNKIVFAVVIVLSVALGAYCGYAFCTQIDIEDGGIPALAGVYIVLLLLSVPVIDALHEVGHFLVGLCCSMGVKMPKIRLISSSAVDVNPKGDKHIKGRMLFTAIAGSILPFLAIVLGIISLTVPSVTIIFDVLLPFGFYHFMINVIPMQFPVGKTDGLVVWEIIKKEPSAEVMLGILKIQGMINNGVKLRDVDETLLLDLPQLPEDDINFIILTQLRYEYYLDKGNDSEAYKYFMRYKEIIKYLPSEYKQ